MIIVLLADGFEELEALSPVDILRRGGLDVRTVGIKDKRVVGTHGIAVYADMCAEELDPDAVELAIFPGGMPGALNLDAAPITDRIIESVQKRGARLAAICAAPLIFGRRGLLKGKRATCFPGFEQELAGAVATGEAVVTDGKITTARDYRAAVDFADELCRFMKQG